MHLEIPAEWRPFCAGLIVPVIIRSRQPNSLTYSPLAEMADKASNDIDTSYNDN